MSNTNTVNNNVNNANNICNNNPIVNVTANDVPLITTRSGRTIKKPEYLKGYVCLINVM